MKKLSIARSMYKRFVIILPGHLVAQISAICEADGLNHSDFFCEAVQAYFAAKSRELQFLMPTGEEERVDNPFHTFTEWNSEADSIYDTLH